ncbi:unnamed protein product, partial [Phaeothamnion confervicola]
VSQANASSRRCCGSCTWPRARACILRNFLPLGFGLALIIGLVWPWPGAQVSSWEVAGYKVVQTCNVVIIFIISGLTLKTSDVKKAFGRDGRRGFAFGIITILFLTPLLGFVIVEIPFAIQEFAYGLAVFCVVPTTLASGVALVSQGGGNDALALLLTVVTNMTGVITVPFLLKGILRGAKTKVDAVALLIKLLVTVLLPLVAGKAVVDTVPGCRTWVARHKLALSLTSSINLFVFVWPNVS